MVKYFDIYFHDEGYKYLLQVDKCTPSSASAYAPLDEGWLISSEYLSAGGNVTAMGSLYGMTASDAGVQQGVVLRSQFSTFHPDGRTATNKLAWNASAADVKTHIESLPASSGETYVVDVTRAVYGKYGVVEWQVTFVSQSLSTPPGSGDVSPSHGDSCCWSESRHHRDY
jgi:hypothetical protein